MAQATTATPERLTQKELNALRGEVEQHAFGIQSARHSVEQVATQITTLEQFQARTLEISEPREYYIRHYTEQLSRIDTLREQLQALKENLREKLEPVAELAETAWRHIAAHPNPKWAQVAERRPKVLRGEGTVLLLRLAAITTTDQRVTLSLALIKQVEQLKRDGRLGWQWWNLPGVNPAGYGAVDFWLADEPARKGSLHEQLKRVDPLESIAQSIQYRQDAKAREVLGNEGEIIDTLDGHPLRLMSSQQLPALGRYLKCCIGNAGQSYRERCETKKAAYVAVYDPDRGMPVAVAEFVPKAGKLELAQAQGRMQRISSMREQLSQWGERQEAFDKVARALDIDLSQGEVTVKVEGDPTHYETWFNAGFHQGSWASSVKFDVSALVDPLISGQANVQYAFNMASNYGCDALSDALRQAVTGRWRSSEDAMQIQMADAIDAAELRRKQLAEAQAAFDEAYAQVQELELELTASR